MFNSEGALPSEIKDNLLNLGFEATKGNYDFVYNWRKDTAEVEELVYFADKVHSSIKNCNVYFSIETI